MIKLKTKRFFFILLSFTYIKKNKINIKKKKKIIFNKNIKNYIIKIIILNNE
ncbi:MAG: hypothetical protein ACH6QP_00060 [Candidatus Carsonella ruddii]